MGDHHRYVPVLQWKQGEREAVRHLVHHDKLRMMPLLEVPVRRAVSNQAAKKSKRPRPRIDWMVDMARSLRDCWGPLLPAFVEVVPAVNGPFRRVGLPDRTEHLFQLGRELQLKLVPVVRLGYGGRRRRVATRIVETDRRGACVRLIRSDLARPDLDTDVEKLLRHLRLMPEEADLIVDLHIVDATGFDLLGLCSRLPFLQRWRSFTVVGGSFPSGLGKASYGMNRFIRHEWEAWQKQVQRDVPRIPGFGDYATQHPVPFNPDVHPTPCANVRYTTESDWVVLKGLQLVAKDALPTDPSRYEQFPAMAVLVNDQPYFRGSHFSYGDQYIHRMAEKFRTGDVTSPGSTTTWLTAAVNHHITSVVIQIDNFLDALDSPERKNEGVRRVRSPQDERTPVLLASSRAPELRRGVPAG